MKKVFNLALCGLLLLSITGCGQSDSKKMVSHLEDVDYKCEENEDKYVCKRIDGDKTETVELEEIDRLLVEYTVEYKNQYTMSINSDQYKNSYCRDYLPQVRESVSMFLNIYEENDIELKLIYSK